MGIYLNPGYDAFKIATNSKIYIDKTELIEYTNQMINTNDRYMCVSRPRRSGKSITANMLAAYYDASVDSKELFDDWDISNSSSYDVHRNKYDVLFLNIQTFLSRADSPDRMIEYLEEKVTAELKASYGELIPKSVVESMRNEEFDSYWTQTETYEALKHYIIMNFLQVRDLRIWYLYHHDPIRNIRRLSLN